MVSLCISVNFFIVSTGWLDWSLMERCEAYRITYFACARLPNPRLRFNFKS